MLATAGAIDAHTIAPSGWLHERPTPSDRIFQLSRCCISGAPMASSTRSSPMTAPASGSGVESLIPRDERPYGPARCSRQALERVRLRVLSSAQVAAYLGHSPTWLARHRSRLEAAGFPRPLPAPFRGAWDLVAIDAWLDHIAGRSDAAVEGPSAWARATALG